MGYVKIGKYDATLRIPQFKGLMQYGDGIDSDPRFAKSARNMETKAGVLQPSAKCELLEPTLPKPIETLMYLYRRWHTGPEEEKTLFVAASDGKLYYMTMGSEWTQLTGGPYQSSNWSWVTYESNPDPDAREASIDVLLISNADDGMYMIRGDNLSVTQVPTPKKFGVIERYAERIWGGAITDDPDMLVYSAPYDPTDWKARAYGAEETEWGTAGEPEDGAGDVMQPSWDGDSFTALRAFGSQLIAFKRNRVWRVLGTDPGEFVFKEQYGGGTPYEKTIAVDSERILMLNKNGIVSFDGMTVAPFYQQYAQDVWRNMNRAALNQSAAVLWNHKYYIAVPMGDSKINNTVVIFDPVDNTWLLRDDVCVESWLWTENDLYFTSSTTPGKIWRWREDSWDTGESTGDSCQWVSQWNTLSLANVNKNDFTVYLLAEIREQPVRLNISIQTENKIKTKQFVLTPEYEETDRKAKVKRVTFKASGRRFRVIIAAPEGTPVWRMVNGIQVKCEVDPD